MTPELIHLVKQAGIDHPPLSKDQERAAHILARAEDLASQHAGRDVLVSSNLRFIAMLSSRRAKRIHLDVDDVFQEAAVAALEMVRKHDPDRGSICTFLKFPVLSGARSELTSRRKDENAGLTCLDAMELEHQPRGDDAAPFDDRIDLVNRRMELLDARSQDIVARFANSETLEEIGRVHGFSKQRAKQLLDEALTMLRGGTELCPTPGYRN